MAVPFDKDKLDTGIYLGLFVVDWFLFMSTGYNCVIFSSLHVHLCCLEYISKRKLYLIILQQF